MQISTKKLFFLHVILWGILEILVNPIGDFPLNDDWAYYQNVYYLSEEGRFFFSDWLAMTLVLQVLWGGLLAKVFGFSFTVLRLGTIFLGVVGTWSCFLFFNKYCRQKLLAYGATLLLIVNPIFFSLSNSFMTEVPFLSVFIPGLFCFTTFLDQEEEGVNGYWWGGLLFSLMATMIRQPGLILPLAFAITYMFKNQQRVASLRILIVGFLPLIFSFSLYKLYSFWLLSTQIDMPVYGEVGQLFRPLWNGSLIFKVITRNTDFLFYCGWFLLPLTLFLWKHFYVITTKLQKVVAVLIAFFLTSSFAFKFHLFPMGNMIGNLWLGPKTLYKDVGHKDVSEFVLSDSSWLVVKWIGILAGFLLMVQLVLALMLHFQKKRFSILMLTIIIAGYYVFLILNPYYNDRYILIFIPLLVPILLSNQTSFSISNLWKYVSIFFFVVLLFFTVTGTHDYLSWNRTAWDLSRDLENNKNISPRNINGGFEYSCWYSNPTFLPENISTLNDTSEYAVSFESALCGWEVEKTINYFQWTFFRESNIYLHKKKNTTIRKSLQTNAEEITIKGDILSFDTTFNFINRAPQDTTHRRSGRYSIRLDKQHRYSFSTDLKREKPCYKITATVWRKRELNPAFPDKKYPSVIVVKTKDFNFHKNTIIEKTTDGWEKIKCEVQLFGYTDAKSVNVYLWNNSGETQWFDDFTLTIQEE